MARMKTGRMTAKMGGPGDGIVVTSKKETVKPREYTSREAQYNSDVAAGEKYKSDLASYEKKNKKYEELKTTGTKDYAVKFGGRKNMRTLSPSETAKFNADMASGIPDSPEYKNVQVPKTSKDFTNAFHGDVVKPNAPIKPRTPNTNDIPMDRMPMLKVTGVKTNQKLAGGKKEKSTEGFFGDYVPSTKGASNKQLKQFASFASKTGLSESFIGKSKAEIGQYKNEMKSQRKAYAKEGNLAGVKATTADIRQSRNAAKFVGSKNPMDVPGMVTGYRKEQDNAANRNTIKSQVDRLKKLR